MTVSGSSVEPDSTRRTGYFSPEAQRRNPLDRRRPTSGGSRVDSDQDGEDVDQRHRFGFIFPSVPCSLRVPTRGGSPQHILGDPATHLAVYPVPASFPVARLV